MIIYGHIFGTHIQQHLPSSHPKTMKPLPLAPRLHIALHLLHPPERYIIVMFVWFKVRMETQRP